MRKVTLSVIVIAIAAVVFGCSSGSKAKVLVEVGNTKITEDDLKHLASMNPRLEAQMATSFGKKKVLNDLVEYELLYKAAQDEGISKDPAIKEKIEIFKKYVIIPQSYLEKRMEGSARKYYDEHKQDYEKLKLSQILIGFKKDKDGKVKRSDKEALDLANKVKARLDGGEDFVVVAKEVSEDTMTNKRGGDLGFASRNEERLMRRGYGPLLEKAFTMKVGEIAGPIKTEDGYSIITVTKGSELQSFVDVAQQILFKTRAGVKDEVIAELKEKYKVTFMEEPERKAKKGEGKTEPKPKPQPEPQTAPQPEVKQEQKPEETK